MAWFGDGLSSLSNLKGQITSFTKEVLAEGIVEETDERTRQLNEANERCVQLQDILNTKDAEISLLRRQNCELQKTVVELNAKPRYSNDSTSVDDDGGGGFFWDPPPVRTRETVKNPDNSAVLQERLAQASVKIRDLEDELKLFKSNDNNDEINDGNRKAELLRAKQDMVNRIIQIGEKSRDAERNLKRLTLDESILINDFQAAISKLDSHEQSCMIRSALKALDVNRDDSFVNEGNEKSDVDEKHGNYERPRLESISLDFHIDDSDCHNGNANAIVENEQLRRKIKELQQENEFLTTSLDELDKQQAQSLDTILAVKDQLAKKHESLQKAYEQLYVECNETQTKLQLLNAKSSSSIEANNNSVSKKCEKIHYDEKHSQTERTSTSTTQASVQTSEKTTIDKNVQTDCETENSTNEQNNLESIENRVKLIVKNCEIDLKNDETLFESIARNYVDEIWKKETLERKLTEMSRELKETSEMRDSLQTDCDDMQLNIESLLVQIEHMKTNLPSIPEASEERVASLESETETMGEEIKRLHADHENLVTKNRQLVETIESLEESLKNKQNLETKLKNANEELDNAKKQLDEASKKISAHENLTKDWTQRSNSISNENEELKKKIADLETSEKLSEKKIHEYDEKILTMEDNSLVVEKLQIDLKTINDELKSSRLRGEKLENDVAAIVESKKELEMDISAISREKEQLESELSVLRQNETKKSDAVILKNLRESLDAANRDRDDLEYDILNMRKELDRALEKLSFVEMQNSKLINDNERLARDNHELLDQLASSHDDYTERIELLQTEMNLMIQENSSLKSEAENSRSEIEKMRKNLEESMEKCRRLDDESVETLKKLEQSNFNDSEKFDKATIEYLETKLNEANGKCEKLEIESTERRSMEQELQSLREKCQTLEKLETTNSTMFETKLHEKESKLRELEMTIDNLQSTINENRGTIEINAKTIIELAENIEKLKFSLEKANENVEMSRETIDGLSQLIKTKDEDISELKSKLSSTTTNENSNDEQTIANLSKEREQLVQLVQEKHNTNLQYYAEIQRLAVLVNEKTVELQRAIAERDEKTAKLLEKDADVHWAQNELQVVRQRLKSLEESQNHGETCGIVEHSVKIAQLSMLNEKCVALEAALVHEQSNNRIIQNQLTESQSRETNAAKELERLRTHLVDIEASYTEEALIAEDNRKQLESKLAQAEEKMQNTSTIYTSASIRSNQQVETLRQQMALIVQQRDEIQHKLSAAEDKVLSHTASLTNLQIVLEQFQRDKESDIRAATDKIRQQLNMSYKEQEDLRNEIVNLRMQLSDAQECLRAASRLSEELDNKSDRIQELNQEVARLTELVNTADQRIQEARMSAEGKVDKNLVKNLLIGFLSSSTIDKSSVLRVFSTILEFDEGERERAGLNNPSANNGWFSGLLGSGGSNPTKDQEASLSAAFVRFLESESKPKPQLPALTISNSPVGRPGHSRQHSSSSTQSGLLLTNVTLPSFPDFVPSRNTGSILKEVLKDS